MKSELLGDVTDAAKRAFTVRNIVLVGLGVFALLIVADLTGFTNWFLYPATNFRAKFLKK